MAVGPNLGLGGPMRVAAMERGDLQLRRAAAAMEVSRHEGPPTPSPCWLAVRPTGIDALLHRR
jgi:hypothetical protein